MSDPRKIAIIEGFWHDLETLQDKVAKYVKTTRKWARDNPAAEVVWLAPTCNACDDDTRQWCEDDVFTPCHGFTIDNQPCKRAATPYRSIR